ncbi:MAG: type 1 glutamine amidotransferase [Aquiluna sp.]
MKALFIQHDHVSPLGPVGERLTQLGFEIETLLVVPEDKYRDPNVTVNFPPASDYDLIIPLGAPWGAWDDGCIGNWLQPELKWIKDAIENDIPVLGICFGGQLMARALGGSVARGPRPELGWHFIHSKEPDLISIGPWFQFHYDRWELPPGAKELAVSPVASQAFSYRRSLALQFHPELDREVLEGWLIWDGREELIEDGQNPDVVLEQTIALEKMSRQRAFELVDNFLGKIAGLLPQKTS